MEEEEQIAFLIVRPTSWSELYRSGKFFLLLHLSPLKHAVLARIEGSGVGGDSNNEFKGVLGT